MGDRNSRWHVFLLVAAILVSVAIVCWAGMRLYQTWAIQAAVAEVREEGYPITLEELNAWYAVPEGGNGADVYMRAIDAVVSATKDMGGGKYSQAIYMEPEHQEAYPVPLPPAVAAQSKECLQRFADAIELFHEGAAYTECRYPVDFTDGAEAELPHLSEVRMGTKLLGMEAILAADEGRPEDAGRALRDMLRLAESLKQEPLLISQLVRTACLSIFRDTLQHVLDRQALPKALLTQLAEDIGEVQIEKGYERGFAGERCLTASSLQDIRQFVQDGDSRSAIGAPALLLLYSCSGLLAADRLASLHHVGAVVSVTKLPHPEQFEATHAVDEDLRQIPFYLVLTDILVSALGRGNEASIRGVGEMRVCAAVLAVEQYRAREHALPHSLSDLVPEYLASMPENPFTGTPLYYNQLDQGYEVTCFGADDARGEAPVSRGSANVSADRGITVRRAE